MGDQFGAQDLSQCRMYENRFPKVDDLVMVKVRQIAEQGAYVDLLEYNNIEGMIPISELSRRRIRSIQKLLRIGEHEVVVVLRVDEEKGYIDLSKRRVTPEDIILVEERYNKSKTVHSIMRRVAGVTQTTLQDLYQQIGWPLYKRFGHAYEAFKIALYEPEKVFAGIVMNDRVKTELMTTIGRRLTPQAIRLRADIEVTCLGEDGIDAIKASLISGQDLTSEKVGIKIKVIAPPLYVIHGTTSLDKQHGIDMMEKCITQIETSLATYAGSKLLVKMRPRVVNAIDDARLDALMEETKGKNVDSDSEDSIRDDDEVSTDESDDTVDRN